jgi:hypothetical protein
MVEGFETALPFVVRMEAFVKAMEGEGGVEGEEFPLDDDRDHHRGSHPVVIGHGKEEEIMEEDEEAAEAQVSGGLADPE